MSTLEKLSSNKVFGGELVKYKFKVLGMLEIRTLVTQSQVRDARRSRHSIQHIPSPSNIKHKGSCPHLPRRPHLYRGQRVRAAPESLYNLTPTSAQKGSFFAPASSQNIAILFPDTSPRGAGAPNEDDSWDFGTGAGFYLDATKPEYATHYRMASFVTEELPRVIEANGLPVVRVQISRWLGLIFQQDFSRQSIFGHSMGGHGALTLYLTTLKSKQYRSASAFAPISNPTKCPWGEKAFTGYLRGGVDEANDRYDATNLISKTTDPVHILVDYVNPLFHPLTRSNQRNREPLTTFTTKDNSSQRTF